MSSFQLCLLLVLLICCDAIDPDVDICKNSSSLDSSVNSVDGNTYIFKGNYYWKTRSLDTQSGIDGYADLIKNKWPEIDPPIIGSFNLHSPKYQTVFVYKNKWISYQRGGNVLKGSTEKWPNFQNLAFNTMFSNDLTKSEIFVIYDDSHRFHIYDFMDLTEPKIVRSGITVINENFLWFIDDPTSRGSKSLKDILKVKTSLSYANTLILMSEKRYCKVNLNAPEYEKKCFPQEIIWYLLECPLDLKGRTSPTPIIPKPSKGDSRPESNTTTHSIDSSHSTTSLETTESAISRNESKLEESNSEEDNKSKIIVAVVIGVIVVIVIAVMIGIIILMFAKKSKTNKTVRNESQRVSRKSIATIQTVDSSTGAPLRSNSIVSLQELNRRK